VTVETMITDSTIRISDTPAATSGVRAVAVIMTADCIET